MITFKEFVEKIVESKGTAFDLDWYKSQLKDRKTGDKTATFHDVKKLKTGTVYTKQVDPDGMSKGSGASVAEPVKRGRGRPKGSKSGARN